jgi:transposase InsO family protein
MASTPKRRPRRQFTDEFKAGVVRQVLDEGKSVGAAARDMDLTETAVRGDTTEFVIGSSGKLYLAAKVFYKQRRRHSTLGQISPAEFERRTMYAA